MASAASVVQKLRLLTETVALFSKFGFLDEASNNRTNDFRAMRQSNSIFVIRF